MKREFLGAICLALAASIWGGMYVVSKYVLDIVTPMSLLWIRYAISVVLLYALLAIASGKQPKGVRQRRPARDWLLLAWIGFVGYFGSISLQFIGTKLSDAHTGALITSATPAFVVVFARFILQESITGKKILSLILATAGVVTVIGLVPMEGTYFKGVLILVGAAVSWALLSVYVKVASNRFTSLEVTAHSMFFALLITTPVALPTLGGAIQALSDPAILAGVLYIALMATAAAFFLWNKGLELMSAGAGSLFLFFQPIVGSLLGWLCLDERLTANFFAGALLIAAGVLTATISERKQKTNA